MKDIIDSPYNDGKAVLEEEVKEAEFRKEKFHYIHFFYRDRRSGLKFTTPRIGDLNLNQIYNQYRERKKIPSSQQIRTSREKYGLSASKMSVILGFGVNSYGIYESGDIPTPANGDILRIAGEPEYFKDEFVRVKEDLFEKKQLDKLYEKLEKLIQKRNDTKHLLGDIWQLWNFNSVPNENCGFTAPGFLKFANMVLFFIHKESKRAFASRLNKLLFYSDFGHYKKWGYSISGATYHANRWGTVPRRSDIAYAVLKQLNYIDTEPAFITNYDEVIERLVQIEKFDDKSFTKEQLDTMNKVYERFKEVETKDLINKINHEERAWKEMIDGFKTISYQKYAFDLKGIGN